MTPTATVFDTAITGGVVLGADGAMTAATVVIDDGRIAGVMDPAAPVEARSTVQADGALVTPGLVDLHTHVFNESTYLGVNADSVGVAQGVTTVVDAGSTGALDFASFQRDVIDASATRVLSFINISDLGLTAGPTELSQMENVATARLEELLATEAHRSIRGIKARMSSSVVGANGLLPLHAARRIADKFSLPIMVHVGNEPPAYADVLDLLVEGDVVSHAFHGKRGGLFADGDQISDAATQARDRGVLFDVGHGSASFSFGTLERALERGFAPDLASTDLHVQNVDGPVYSLATTLTKLLALGLSLVEVLAYATTNASRVLGDGGTHGSLSIGNVADLSFVRLTDERVELTDSDGDTRTSSVTLSAVGAIRGGVHFAAKTRS